MPEVKAKIYQVEETEHKSGFSFRKFIAITEYDGKYPQYVQFECAGDNTVKLDNIFIDDIVNLHYNLRGRAWTNESGKVIYFNKLDVWKIEVLESVRSATVKNNPPKVETKNTLSSKTEPDGLPF